VSIPNLGAFDVISSADLKAAVTRAVEARIFSNGPSCIAAKRIIVPELIADEFEGKFVKRMQDLKGRRSRRRRRRRWRSGRGC
jgi:acyl-CoA reductase-like NAD-dependent aldehyde dehydrogenase